MKLNPYLSGLSALAYVGAVALLITHIYSLHHDTPDTVLDSIAALSLFVFSATVMAFLFFYRPLVLLLDTKKDEALIYFTTTLCTFGIGGLFALMTRL